MTLGRLTSVDSNDNGWFKMIQNAVSKDKEKATDGAASGAGQAMASPKTVKSLASSKSSRATAENLKKQSTLEAIKSRQRKTILPGTFDPIFKARLPNANQRRAN